MLLIRSGPCIQIWGLKPNQLLNPSHGTRLKRGSLLLLQGSPSCQAGERRERALNLELPPGFFFLSKLVLHSFLFFSFLLCLSFIRFPLGFPGEAVLGNFYLLFESSLLLDLFSFSFLLLICLHPKAKAIRWVISPGSKVPRSLLRKKPLPLLARRLEPPWGWCPRLASQLVWVLWSPWV